MRARAYAPEQVVGRPFEDIGELEECAVAQRSRRLLLQKAGVARHGPAPLGWQGGWRTAPGARGHRLQWEAAHGQQQRAAATAGGDLRPARAHTSASVEFWLSSFRSSSTFAICQANRACSVPSCRGHPAAAQEVVAPAPADAARGAAEGGRAGPPPSATTTRAPLCPHPAIASAPCWSAASARCCAPSARRTGTDAGIGAAPSQTARARRRAPIAGRPRRVRYLGLAVISRCHPPRCRCPRQKGPCTRDQGTCEFVNRQNAGGPAPRPAISEWHSAAAVRSARAVWVV